MQIKELVQFIEWFNENVVETQLPSKYTAFYTKINTNVRQGQVKQPFEIEKEALFDILKSIDYQSLSLEQLKFLESHSLKNLLGKEGIENINNILFESNIDIATAAKKIVENRNILNTAIKNISELENAIVNNFDIDDNEDISDGKVLMRVYFQNDVSIDNLTDFKKLSAIWYDIGRGIAMAQDKTPDDFTIIGAKKGSIIIEMAVAVTLATSVSKILLEALKVADRFLEVLKKVQELKSLKLNNTKIEKELKIEAEKEKENGIKSILEIAIVDLKLDIKSQGDKVNAIEKSISKLVNFTENGGLVDFVQPDEVDEENPDKNLRDEVKKLNNNINEIRLLENKTKLLGNKTA